MKKWNCSVTSILMFAVLFLLMPQKSATAQKLINETLQSKTLVEEDDGFKWYRYVYEYQVKFGGNKINLTRESAYKTNGRVLIDGSLNIDWIKEECRSKSMKKKYKQYPSEIKKEYSLILEYVPSYGLFVAKRGINDREVLGTFSKEGMCFTYLGGLGDNGILWSGKPAGYYLKGGEKWLWGKAKYGGHGVVKEGKVVVPMSYDRIKVENGLYFGEGCANSNDVYTSDGVLIGTVSYDYYTEKSVSHEFFDGPNGEKWLKYCNSGYYRDNKHKGFYYCLESGKKIDYGSNAVPEYHIEGRYLMLDDLYKGDGERITNNEYTNVEKHLSSNNTSDFFLVSKGRDRKGVIKVEGNSYKEVIACEYEKISCLNKDGNGDLFLVERPYNGDIYNEGVMKVEGDISKTILECNYNYDGNSYYESLGIYDFSKKTDEYYDVVINGQGEIVIPFGKYYMLGISEGENTFHGFKKVGNTGYIVTLDFNGKELSCDHEWNITPKSTAVTTTEKPKQETKPTPSPTPTPQPQPQPRQPQPFQVWQPCFMCGGSGQCRYCYGYGWAANGKAACGICHGTGKCSQCAGHGGQNVIEYR